MPKNAVPRLSLKAQSPQVNIEDIWSDDALERKKCADALTNLIADQYDPIVISLNGKWGSGKTFFLKRWEAQLNKDGFKTFYFNTWEDDYHGDPLVAIIGQIWKEIKSSEFKEIGNSIKEAAKPLFEKTIFNIVKASTNGIVDLVPSELKSCAESAVDIYICNSKLKKELKNRLKELSTEIYKKNNKPTVFIIDELDRCRPTFAIELLERVKHVFDIPNMVFVIGVDRIQLGHSIRSIYGKIDVEGYLCRIIDIDLILPPADPNKFLSHLWENNGITNYIEKRCSDSNNKRHIDESKTFKIISSKLCSRLNFSLRDIEHLSRMFLFAIKNTEYDNYVIAELLAIMLCLKIKAPELYIKFASGKCYPSKIAEYFESFIKENDFQDLWSKRLEAIIYAMEYEPYITNEPNIVTQLKLLAENPPKKLTHPDQLSPKIRNLMPNEAQDFLEILRHITNRHSFDYRFSIKSMHYLAEKIELATLMVDEH